MAKWQIIFAAALWVSFAASAQDGSNDDVLEYDTAGNWSIRVDGSMGYRCFAFVTYENDNVALRVGANSSGDDFYFAVGDTRWRSIQEGKNYPIKIEFDSYGAWNADAKGVDFGGIKALWVSSITQDFLLEFAKADALVISYDGADIMTLELTGSAKALAILAECESDVDGVLAETGLDPFAGRSGNQSDPFSVGGRND